MELGEWDSSQRDRWPAKDQSSGGKIPSKQNPEMASVLLSVELVPVFGAGLKGNQKEHRSHVGESPKKRRTHMIHSTLGQTWFIASRV